MLKGNENSGDYSGVLVNSKSQLAIMLSRLNVFEKPKNRLEQYPTDSEIAATILWAAYMNGDIKEKIIADFGCGTGILGIGALILGAKKVFFVDVDKDVFENLKTNLGSLDMLDIEERYEIFESDLEMLEVDSFSEKPDTIITNPPFGTRIKHADRMFLKKSFKISSVVYSIHKSTSKKFLSSFSKDSGFSMEPVGVFSFPIKSSYGFHRKKIERIEVIIALFKKQKSF